MVMLMLNCGIAVASGILCIYMIIKTKVIFDALNNHKKHIDDIIKRQDTLDMKWKWLSGNYDSE